MSGENNQTNDQTTSTTDNDSTTSQTASTTSSTEADGGVAKLVAEQVAEALKPIKEKLNNAFRERDEAKAKAEELEKKEREANIKRMQEEGKHKEAAELLVAEERVRRETAERRVVELTRDVDVKDALGTLEFRSEAAREMALKEVTSQLVSDGKGGWTHKSGISIKDFVKVFSDSDANSFLFKAKVSSGGGSSTTTSSTTVDTTKDKSVFALSQSEVLKLAEKGQLRRRNR